MHSRRVVSCPKQPRACHWDFVIDIISVAWSDRDGQLAAGGFATVWRSWVILAGSTVIYRFLYGLICDSLCQSINIKPTKMDNASTRAQSKINTHGCWNWHLCIPDGLSVVQCSLGHVLEIVFIDTMSAAWSDHAGRLVAVPQSGGREFNPRRDHDNSSVPLWVLCDSLCHRIKIKATNMYIARASAQFEINTHGCWNWHLCIPDGLSVVQCGLGHVIEIVFIDTISVAWSDRAGKLAVLPQPGGREFNPRLVHDNLWIWIGTSPRNPMRKNSELCQPQIKSLTGNSIPRLWRLGWQQEKHHTWQKRRLRCCATSSVVSSPMKTRRTYPHQKRNPSSTGWKL